MMRIAITREVSRSITQCELTHLSRQAIDVELARRQHSDYEKRLNAAGYKVHRLPEEPELPDAVFVEDVAIVFDELAIITRPGAASRRSETRAVAEALEAYRSLGYIKPPGTIDGGDILRVDMKVYVGISSRSNLDGLEQMKTLLTPHGYSVESIEVGGCLHLKSAITQVDEGVLLVNSKWVNSTIWQGMEIIEIDQSEPYAANALWVGEGVIYPSSYPRTQERLAKRGIRVETVDVSELIKAEGAVTCCSLVFDVQ